MAGDSSRSSLPQVGDALRLLMDVLVNVAKRDLGQRRCEAIFSIELGNNAVNGSMHRDDRVQIFRHINQRQSPSIRIEMADAIFAGGVGGNFVRPLYGNDNTRVLGRIASREQRWVDFSRRLEGEALRRSEFRGHLL